VFSLYFFRALRASVCFVSLVFPLCLGIGFSGALRAPVLLCFIVFPLCFSYISLPAARAGFVFVALYFFCVLAMKSSGARSGQGNIAKTQRKYNETKQNRCAQRAGKSNA
jgi:hypothetical protein